MVQIRFKNFFALFFLLLIALACNSQNAIDGEWYLQEIQIPSYEEYVEGIIINKLDHFILRSQRPPMTQEDIDAFMSEFDAAYDEAVASMEETDNNTKSHQQVDDTRDFEEILDEIYIKSGIEYELSHDTVLRLFVPKGYPGYFSDMDNGIYVIKELTKDRLVLARERTLYGCVLFVYGRTHQPIKYTKHNIMSTDKYGYPNPIVNRLNYQELSYNRTPASVVYNFVQAILQSNTEKILSYLDAKTADSFEAERQIYGYANYDPFFSEKGSKLNILGWKPYLSNNCEVAILFVQSEWFDEFGREIKKVYVGCVPSAEIGRSGFQDITTYGDTNVKVLVANDGGIWKVVGFK